MPPKPYASIFAITSQPHDRLVKTMRALCHDDKFREQAYMYLDKLSRHARELKEQYAKISSATSVKRDLKTMGDVEICVQCNQPFHEDDNDEKSCFYHPDDMEADEGSDVWVDWDERCHGPIDTAANRKSFPDGFIYECCEKDGTSKGCTWGEHKTAEDPQDVLDAEIAKHIATIDAANAKRAKLNSGAAKPIAKTGSTQGEARKTPAIVNPPPPKPLDCIQCGLKFYETGNTDRSCDYHDGETELDEDAEIWCDMYAPREFSDVDTPEGRQEHPEGFKYTCCGRTLENPQKGCKQSKHKAVETETKPKEGSSNAKKRKLDSEDKENQPQEVIEISDDE